MRRDLALNESQLTEAGFDMGWVPRAARAAVAASDDAAGEAADHNQQEEDADDRAGDGAIGIVVAALIAFGRPPCPVVVVDGDCPVVAASVLEVPLALPAGGGGRVVRWDAVGGAMGGGAGGRAAGGRAALALYLVISLHASLLCRATRAGASLNV